MAGRHRADDPPPLPRRVPGATLRPACRADAFTAREVESVGAAMLERIREFLAERDGGA